MGVVVDSDRMFRRSPQSLARTIRIGQASAGSVTVPMTVVDDLSYWAGSVLSDPNNECVRAQMKLAIGQGQKRRGEGPESLAIWFDDASAAWPLHGLPSMPKTALAVTSGQATRNG